MRLVGSVTIPKRPSTIGGLISWARGVNRTLQELRDRKVVGNPAVIKFATIQRPFCYVFQLEGQWMLYGGTVTAGEGNEVVADIDLGEIGAEPAEGTYFWLVCEGEAVTEDDVLLGGINLTSVTTGSGLTLPDNTIPTAADPTGILHVALGSWSQGRFIPADCGNIQISHCPGNLSFTRGA